MDLALVGLAGDSAGDCDDDIWVNLVLAAAHCPELYHNLRSSRQTELTEVYPTHVVCAWLGNSPAVAHAHYLQVRDQHFDAAAGLTPGALQKAMPHGAERPRTVSQPALAEVA